MRFHRGLTKVLALYRDRGGVASGTAIRTCFTRSGLSTRRVRLMFSCLLSGGMVMGNCIGTNNSVGGTRGARRPVQCARRRRGCLGLCRRSLGKLESKSPLGRLLPTVLAVTGRVRETSVCVKSLIRRNGVKLVLTVRSRTSRARTLLDVTGRDVRTLLRSRRRAGGRSGHVMRGIGSLSRRVGGLSSRLNQGIDMSRLRRFTNVARSRVDGVLGLTNRRLPPRRG